MNGLFITIEGPDGSGKSTQIKKLAEFLQGNSIPFILTREPGGTAVSDRIRSLILDPAHPEMADETEVLLYAASRAQHVKEKIVPALQEGKLVLCDRFVDASVAYQAYGLGIPVEDVTRINRFATGGLKPDRSYLIDVAPEIGRQRMVSRYSGEGLDRIEQKELDYHERVRSGFQKIYEENRERFLLVAGNQTVDEVFDEIIKDIKLLLANRYK
ncbi:dTMP kinase [Fictibacillus enclensis]|uniref:Thymidylate kinase n=1 Tax=Fictibacillus enclensis TaxID=1017270 RepID=A0A0V8IP81_9BACL|nr:dTMP kinase [Fictibacillus enclensis]KSU76563.1 thymidylate kinase [Fictibacillus enclensis]SCC42524.1 dTMP kinase [Fictibacillus enclensis]